jgi:hypothetical protein
LNRDVHAAREAERQVATAQEAARQAERRAAVAHHVSERVQEEHRALLRSPGRLLRAWWRVVRRRHRRA